MEDYKGIFTGLQEFALLLQSKMSQPTHGEPEDQLRAPFENFMRAVGQSRSSKLECTGETALPRIGKPDYAVHVENLLVGHVELKAPGTGANPKRYRGHNRDQWNRFQSLPNLIYCDGNEWGLYRDGEPARSIVRLSGPVETEGMGAVSTEDAVAIAALLTDFLQWHPIVPTVKGRVDWRLLAELLAPLCRLLRGDVTDAMTEEDSPLDRLSRDWRQLLFPNATDEQFADAYAQTVTFALLLGRSEGADPLTLESAVYSLMAEHSLLSKALEVLTDRNARSDVSASLDLLQRVIAELPAQPPSGPVDPWLYFYEDFLAAYDPKLRKDAGAYYTPVEVVRAQVRLIDNILANRLGRPLGFADSDVVILDPAVGTGTYLLGVVEHALLRVKEELGPGAVPGQATTLARNIHGFEIMVGPYAVSELRVSRSLYEAGAELPDEGTHIYLTDTLESPNTKPPHLGFTLEPIAEQHRRALEVKRKVPVIVCLGNPPYDRHAAVDPTSEESLAPFGGWVRFSDELLEASTKGKRAKKAQRRAPSNPGTLLRKREQTSILYAAFVKPALEAGHAVHLKNLYNLYVYFWRWALWKVFEHESAPGPGVVSFITASSYLDGDAFCGMREHMRRLCDEIWILDLGGEGRGTRKSENVFAIQTPVAIAIAVRSKKPRKTTPAKVRFTRIEGSRDDKLEKLNSIVTLSGMKWEECPNTWQAPFRPATGGLYPKWPLLTDLMPWQHSGAQFKRTWPIAPAPEVLKKRWRGLMRTDDRAHAFRETRDRKVNSACASLQSGAAVQEAIARLPARASIPPIERYAYRSFDRQWILADNRLGDFLRPVLWAAHSVKQVYLTGLLTKPLGTGPALAASAYIPDLDHFSGRGAKDVIPLYRDAKCGAPNVLPGLLDVLSKEYRRVVSPDDLFTYIYGVLAQPDYTKQYEGELETRQVRVPLTKEANLFQDVRDVGAYLLWLHTYAERFVPKGKHRGRVPRGTARCVDPVPGTAADYPEMYEYQDQSKTLKVGSGKFAPVAPEVYEFEVSGLKVVQSWLKYRMKRGSGKKLSPLDEIRPDRWPSEFTTDFLELLWVLEATLEQYPSQANLLATVIASPCFTVNEIPAVPDSARKAPSRSMTRDLFD